MKNKSKELAKILNIKPKYRGSRWEFKDRIYFVNSKIFDTKEEAEEYNEEGFYNEEEFEVKELNVDFKNPSNFVQLYEISHKGCKAGEVILLYNGKCAVDSLIEQLIRFGDKIKKVKQLAQKINWKY